MRKKVLIYVQAYNAEKTLERCLKSIEMQTYKEFECVIYDNGSKDDTEKIANRFSEKDGRFIVVLRDENDFHSIYNILNCIHISNQIV